MKYLIPSLLAGLLLSLVTTVTANEEKLVQGENAALSEVVAAPVPQISLESIPGTDIQVGDFVVGPGRIEVEVKPGETVIRDITVTNRISNGRTFELLIEDMSGSQSGDKAVVLLGDQQGPYSLRDYFTLPSTRINLELGERARIPVSITMPHNAEPGGYYGAILVSTVSDNGDHGGVAARSPVIARVGTLFFITVPGEVKKESKLIDFSTVNNNWWFDHGPIDLLVTHENTGSMHLNPYGEVRVTNMFGSEVGYVELTPWFVLPGSLRVRELTWTSELLLGRYSITAYINRGYDDIVDTKTIYVWVVPWQIIVSVFVGLFMLIFTVRLFFSKFELKRK